jgi:hypothetical protein
LGEIQLLAPADRAGSTVFRTSGPPEQLATMLALLGVKGGPVAAL